MTIKTDIPITRVADPLPPLGSTLEIAESVTGYWVYHLRRKGEFRSLCGRHVMSSGMTPAHWGLRGHIGEKYCAECPKLALEAV